MSVAFSKTTADSSVKTSTKASLTDMSERYQNLSTENVFKRDSKVKIFCFNEQSSIEPAEETCDEIFDQMILSVNKRRGEAKQLIGAQREAVVTRAEKLQLQLETEISDMKKRDSDLEQLSHTDDHIHFIQVPLWCRATLPTWSSCHDVMTR